MKFIGADVDRPLRVVGQFGCGTRILRVIHGRVEHPSGAAPPGTPHSRATFSNCATTPLRHEVHGCQSGIVLVFMFFSYRYF